MNYLQISSILRFFTVKDVVADYIEVAFLSQTFTFSGNFSVTLFVRITINYNVR